MGFFSKWMLQILRIVAINNTTIEDIYNHEIQFLNIKTWPHEKLEHYYFNFIDHQNTQMTTYHNNQGINQSTLWSLINWHWIT